MLGILHRSLMALGAASKPLSIHDYVTFEALEDGLTVSLTVNTCEYCIDGDLLWVSLPPNTATPPINKGQTLSFRANNLVPTSSAGIGTFSVSHKCNLLGNVLSMLYGNQGRDRISIDKDSAFAYLFEDCDKIITISPKFLPAVYVSAYCYHWMFAGCTALTNAPELPAEISFTDKYCYDGMFLSCHSLEKPPKLPSTFLAQGCYQNMFDSCISLKEAPELNARLSSSYSKYCYNGMFRSCIELTTMPNLQSDILAEYCYQYMFSGCTKLKTAVLPARTLTKACYERMFYNCESLNSIKMMATDISANACISNWVWGVASSGTFVKNSAATWNVVGVSGIPEGWTVETADA